MSTEQAGSVVIQVTAGDFERLCENSADGVLAREQPLRFEALGGTAWSRQWGRIYWTGTDYTAVIFARAFLAARGFDYEILYDTEEDPEGRPFGYVILTDYEEA